MLRKYFIEENISPQETLRQVAELCLQVIPGSLSFSSDQSSFSILRKERDQNPGILSAVGKLAEDKVIPIRMEIFSGTEELLIPSAILIKHLSALSDITRFSPPQKTSDNHVSFWVEVKVKAAPLSMARTGVFLEELNKVDSLAKFLQVETPLDCSNPELDKIYHSLSESLRPVYPLSIDSTTPPNLLPWARESVDLLSGNFTLALASPFPGNLQIGLAALALAAGEQGRTLGQLVPPQITAKGLNQLLDKAPGWVVVPCLRVNMEANVYEISHEMNTFLAALAENRRALIFTGSYEDLRSIFHGGQGGRNDPLRPVLRYVPDIPLESLIRFTLRSVWTEAGGLTPGNEDRLLRQLQAALQDINPALQKRILPELVQKLLLQRKKTRQEAASALCQFAALITGARETIAGMSPQTRVFRSSEVQDHYTRTLTDPALFSFFQDHLQGQDQALNQLVSRLTHECLTRPLHQPIRYCAQGSPATGKSESAVLLARRLNIPHINIDAASIPDYYIAAAQLLGSGRGIVGSYQSGRLEQAAKHHAGVVLEISDLDHAPAHVRAALGDLFLQVLETGEAQSSTGAMFSCANIIFAFTMNLPGILDETVRKGIGFNPLTSERDIQQKVIGEIKRMLSAAFLSRVGTPIFFRPLDETAQGEIIEKAVKQAILSGAQRLGSPAAEIVLEPGLGAGVVASLKTKTTVFGVRLLLEQGRALAAQALMELRQKGALSSGLRLRVKNEEGDRLKIEVV